MNSFGISPFIRNGLVIQRGKKFPLFSAKKITVLFLNKSYEAELINGKWLVTLDPAEAGGPFSMTIKSADESFSINNIYTGDVWLCSGQSNMEWQMHLIKDNYPEEWQLSEYPVINHFKVPNEWDFSAPRDDINGGQWTAASQKTLNDFSAVAWFFAKNLYQKYIDSEGKAVPIGLVNASWGGTPIESWMSRDALASYPAIIKDGEQYSDPVKREELIKIFPEDVWIHYKPMGDYNAMVSPLLKYPFKGVIWYQGESNCARANEYESLFKLMIQDWRTKNNNTDLPFLFVQLPFWLEESDNNENSGWALLREAQASALSLPATGMACALELGDAEDIHPVNKKDVGYRLFLAAEKLLFNAENTSPGPMAEKYEIKDKKLFIYFNNCGDGIHIISYRDTEEQSFVSVIYEEQQIDLPVTIEKINCISVDLSSVKNPKKVLYAWADNPKHRNLFNSDGLPVVPFKIELVSC